MTDKGIGELEMEELIPEWSDEEIKGFDSRDKVKHNKKSDQLFFKSNDWRSEQYKDIEQRWSYEGMEVG